MMLYVVVGVISFFVGELAGIFVASLGHAAKERDEYGKSVDDPCKNCFGASMGDCEVCDKRKER